MATNKNKKKLKIFILKTPLTFNKTKQGLTNLIGTIKTKV